MKDKMMKLGAISNDLPFSISVPLTSLSSYLPVSPLLSPPLPSLSLSLLLALLSVLSRRQSKTASVFGEKGDIEADLRTPGSGEAISPRCLGPRGVMNRGAVGAGVCGGGEVKVKHEHGARFPGLMTRSEIGSREGSE